MALWLAAAALQPSMRAALYKAGYLEEGIMNYLYQDFKGDYYEILKSAGWKGDRVDVSRNQPALWKLVQASKAAGRGSRTRTVTMSLEMGTAMGERARRQRILEARDSCTGTPGSAPPGASRSQALRREPSQRAG